MEIIARVPADTIRQLAREYAMSKPAALIQGYGPQRHANGEQVVRGGTVLAAITGNIGIKGGWASGAGFTGRQTIPWVPIPENPFKVQSLFISGQMLSCAARKWEPRTGLKVSINCQAILS